MAVRRECIDSEVSGYVNAITSYCRREIKRVLRRRVDLGRPELCAVCAVKGINAAIITADKNVTVSQGWGRVSPEGADRHAPDWRTAPDTIGWKRVEVAVERSGINFSAADRGIGKETRAGVDPASRPGLSIECSEDCL